MARSGGNSMPSRPGHGQRVLRRAPGLPPVPKDIYLASFPRRFDRGRVAALALGLCLFAVIYFAPRPPDAIDVFGQRFPLGREGQASIALFVLAALWWAFEVVPIGVTGIAVGLLQALLLIRPPKAALGDLFDPAVWFVVGSLTVGMAFARTGLTQRIAYRMLPLFGERTRFIYLGAFATTSLLALVMAHSAAAAAVFPLLMAIYPLYDEGKQPTRFGKGLFIGMAMSAGAGSICSLLGSARAPVALGLFEHMAARSVSFYEVSYYLLPLGWTLVLAIWVLMLGLFPPEKHRIDDLQERLRNIGRKLGPLSAREIVTLLVVAVMLLALSLGSFAPAVAPHKSAVIVTAMVTLFLAGVLELRDLEAIPWNVVLLFGGATSLGLCLWQTGAARWVAVQGLALWGSAHWLLFVLGLALLVLVLTNVIVNAAALAIVLPVGLVSAPYLGLAPEVIFYAAVSAAGLPLLLLMGAAPNAMAYESRQFTSAEFLRAGLPTSVVVMVVVALFVLVAWPLMGMCIRR
jgi:sodium-dependent dicarboxylate transporter 2/3/5